MRPPRFRLRTLLVAVAVIAAVMGIVVSALGPTGLVRRAIEEEIILLIIYILIYTSLEHPGTWVALIIVCLEALVTLNLVVAAIGWWRRHAWDSRARDRAADRPWLPVPHEPPEPPP